MNWKLIKKDKKNQPKAGIYSDWKEQIAEECFYQCIYCSINEAQFGGIDHYHIEHYKPKSIDRFKPLENDILNLFYSCPICNRFKSNDWPNDADDLNIVCYPDPSEYNYSELFDLDVNTYKLIGKYTSTKYMTERLFFNRAQLIYERREAVLREKENELFEKINVLRGQDEVKNDLELVHMILDVTINLKTTLAKRNNIRPYKLAEIRK